MESPRDTAAASHDLSALAWVQEELRKTLETAQRALRRYAREVEASTHSDLDDVDPSILRAARQHLHLGVGALELVNVPEGAMLLRASESLVQRFVAKPQRLEQPGIEAIERGSFALLDYLGRRLAGKPVNPVGLFPQLRALQELCGAERVHPADLWPLDWRWRPVAAALPVSPRAADAAILAEVEKQLLMLVRSFSPQCGVALRRDCCMLAAGAASVEEATLWRLAAGFFDACAQRGLDADVFVKRTASRVLSQLRTLVRAKAVPDQAVSERLAQDLLFFCAYARCDTVQAPCLAAVRQAYELGLPPSHGYAEVVYGRFDPAWVVQARKRVEAAKDVWSGVAAGESQRLTGLVEAFTLVADSIHRLYPAGGGLGDALLNIAEQTCRQNHPPAPELAMEVATSVLYLEASLEDREFDHPEQGLRIERLVGRLHRTARGEPSEPLEPWMEELYRRISDRQTMGSVVQELRASLSEVERQIDQFFRRPVENAQLAPVPTQLVSMRGVLSVLGIDAACEAASRMAADVRHLVDDQPDPKSPVAQATFQRLAVNLGALGFLIDMLGVQPQMARALFRFDTAAGVLAPLMGRHAMAPDLVDRAQAIAEAVRREDMPLDHVAGQLHDLSRQPQINTQPELAATLSSAREALSQIEEAGAGPHTVEAVREHIAQAMDDFVATATGPLMPEPAGIPLISKPMDLGPPEFAPTGLEDDDEMRGVFLEEAHEVLAQAGNALHALEQSPADHTQIVTVRRAFHTLKGSSRMVGLTAFGEAAWACEQLYNRWLADQSSASIELRAVTADALEYFAAWTEAIAAHRDSAFVPEPVVAAADALRLAGEMMHVRLPQQQAAAPAVPAVAPVAAVSAPPAGLDLEFPMEEPGAPVFEQLEATRPAALDPAPEPAPSDELPVLDLIALDMGTAVPAVDLDLDLDLSADVPPLVSKGPPVSLEDLPELSDSITPSAASPYELSLPSELEQLGIDPSDVEQIEVGHELGSLGESEIGRGIEIMPAAGTPPPESGDSVDLMLDLTPAAVPASGAVSEPAVPPAAPDPAEALELQPEVPEPAAVIGFDLIELPSVHGELQPAANEAAATWPHLPDAQPLSRPAELYPLHAPDSELPTIVPPSQMAVLLDEQAKDQEPPSSAPSMELIELDLGLTSPGAVGDAAGGVDLDLPLDLPTPTPEVAPAPAPAAAPADEPQPAGQVLSSDQFKHIGSLRLPIPLFNIYLNEADELSRRLGTELSEWSLELERRLGEMPIALAHSLAGSSATVGFHDLSGLARDLEHALTCSDALGSGSSTEAMLFLEAAEEIRRLLHQFAAGFLQSPPTDLRERLQRWAEQTQERLDDRAIHPDERPPVESQPITLGSPSTAGELTPSRLDRLLASVPALVNDTGATPLAPELRPESVPVLDLVLDSALAPASVVEPDTGASEPEVEEPSAGLSASADGLNLLESPSAIVSLPEEAAAEQVDQDLFPVFQEEAEELLPLLAQQVKTWLAAPGDMATGKACMRTLHTFKGGARLSGAMRLGDLAHRLETLVEQLLMRERIMAADLAPLQPQADELASMFEEVRSRFLAGTSTTMAPLPMPTLLASLPTADAWAPARIEPAAPPAAAETAAPATDETRYGPDPDLTRASALDEAAGTPAPIDWSHLVSAAAPLLTTPERGAINVQPVRVKPQLLDRLVNLAGEVSIARSRLEAEVGQIRSSLGDLADNLDRLNQQLHDITIQAETQMESRMEAARAVSQEFDPLEMDRYTRLQELTRMMAESVNDVATVRGTLQRALQTTEDELASQARLTRELQSDLLRTRMIEFDSLAERLQRVVRQAAAETGKQVRLEISGGNIEIDRGVLDRMTAAFEHLLRNCVTHGIEPADQRRAVGKDPVGVISIAVEQDGNEVAVDLQDDGAGLDLGRIRDKALVMGLLPAQARPTEKELMQLIFAPGLTTMGAVTELAGRGVGMDVVRADVQALGGRIETRTGVGRGTGFKMVLPLTTVVTQVVMLRAGTTQIAVPSYLIESVQRATVQSIEKAYQQGVYSYGGQGLPFFWLGALLRTSGHGGFAARTHSVVIVRSAQQRVALHVDEVLGNHEVVVKNLGSQLARVPGLAGMTLLASGVVALIYNPVALAAVYGDAALRAMHAALQAPSLPHVLDASLAPPAPLVLVVDDSLTVRRVTKRMLDREGYRVALAKDGLEALEALASGERPAVVLSDIEMPRMDGFDLLRNIRADAKLGDLPVVMITSRIAQKHRELALQLGANHYLGKPYSEEELMGLVNSYVTGAATQPG